MTKFHCSDAADVQVEIVSRRYVATARLLMYGELRGKPHTVVNPEQYSHTVESMKNE